MKTRRNQPAGSPACRGGPNGTYVATLDTREHLARLNIYKAVPNDDAMLFDEDDSQWNWWAWAMSNPWNLRNADDKKARVRSRRRDEA